MNRLGVLKKHKKGRFSEWSYIHGHNATITGGAMPLWGEGREDDGRLAPRMRGIRTDVEETLISLLRRMAQPATIEEINAAWGRLRVGGRLKGTLADDIQYIVEAKRKREERDRRRYRSLEARA